MQEPFFIKRVAVLGAGVMGAQIAALCSNAGFETYLFDLASEGDDPYALINKSIKHLTKIKPTPLATKNTLLALKPCVYENDLEMLKSCDLVIEAIAEQLEIKEALYQKIAPFIGDNTVLVSNTSGLSINTLKEVLPEALHPRFCGVHFFNPPRYMHLAELIPHDKTKPELLDSLETWLTSGLGKGVVRAKDTPNFIANRIGVFSLLATLYHAERLNLGFDVVDALTGALLGRPKSATFRTMDVVGLDTLQHVVNTMLEHLEDDPWHPFFKLPDWLKSMIAQGNLGQKSGCGIYRKNGKTIEVYDVSAKDYRPQAPEITDEVKSALKLQDKSKVLNALLAIDGPEAELITSCFRDLFHYAAFHLEGIADTVFQVDAALKWGFGWEHGPFETWQAFGVDMVLHWLNVSMTDSLTMSDATLPEWLNVSDFLFYKGQKAFSPKSALHELPSELPVYQKQHLVSEANRVLYENNGVTLNSLPDDIALLSFKSKSNTIGSAVIEGINASIEYAERHCKGLVIYQHNPMNFSSGADLSAVLKFIEADDFDAISQMVKAFQATLMRIKYCMIPVVSALRGRALGGGCEQIMQSDAVVAAFESYPGLVEVGVGLIPAGGGSKEFAIRAATHAGDHDLTAFLKPYFEQIAMANVAGSAPEALEQGYLRSGDTIVMHSEEVLYASIAKVKALQAPSYRPPLPKQIKVAGREGFARLKCLLVNYERGSFISEHDTLIATELARVMTGGDIDEGSMVDEAWLLRLEHDAFMTLVRTQATQARIRQMLETGRALRN